MIIIKLAADIKKHLEKFRSQKSLIGFVPTMGALHEGHISLLKKCEEICDVTVCSIFINPTQFNNQDDFKKYPVTPEKDIYFLEENGCDILFTPDVNEIYPDGFNKDYHFDIGYLENILEGEFRPGHFQGVCNVVKRLLDIVEPKHLFLGQKDYQQCLVIKKLLGLMNANINVTICPTLREQSGLAMSSRNLRLNDEQKKQAAEIYKSLLFIKEKLKPGYLNNLKEEVSEYLLTHDVKPEYVEFANADDLKIINDWDGKQKIVTLIAAFVADVRLIDNLILSH